MSLQFLFLLQYYNKKCNEFAEKVIMAGIRPKKMSTPINRRFINTFTYFQSSLNNQIENDTFFYITKNHGVVESFSKTSLQSLVHHAETTGQQN